MKEGEQPPKDATEGRDDLSQEELLKAPVHIPHRPKKDPRELRILDPACGSGHFLLYCFDLLLTIYEEAYADPDLGPALQKDYPKLEDLQRDVPRLILAHNLHGIDIDVRASQIAALALWLRCQRAYQEMGLKKDRPRITRSNFVCAEPMPGEEQMLKEFVAQLEPKLLGQVVEVVFDKMKLAGEAGSLLKIEEEIRDTVASAKKQWVRETTQATDRKGQPLLFTQAALDRIAGRPTQTGLFDLSDITEDQFFEEAEAKTIEALRQYTEKNHNGQKLRRRLFTEDAVHGFAFVDLCNKRYDVVLMNPPFGLPPVDVFAYLKKDYPFAYVDLYPAFLTRGQLLSPTGLIGAITSRSYLMTPRMTGLRENLLLDRLLVLLDLGPKVMDDAEVESCVSVYSGQPSLLPQVVAFNLRFRETKDPLEIKTVCGDLSDCYVPKRADLKQLPGGRIFYSVPSNVHLLLRSQSRFEPYVGTARQGLTTFDDFRFLRAHWEVAAGAIGRTKVWVPFSKGGAYSKYYSDLYLLVRWENDGKEMSEKNLEVNGQTAQARQASDYYFRAGGTYSQRGKGFSVRALPANSIIGVKGPAILSESAVPKEYIIGWLNSDLISSLIHLQANKYQYNTGILKRLPWIDPPPADCERLSSIARELIIQYRDLQTWNERDSHYTFQLAGNSIEEIASSFRARRKTIEEHIFSLNREVDALVEGLYGITGDSVREAILGNNTDDGDEDEEQIEAEEGLDTELIDSKRIASSILSYAVGCHFGRWDVTHCGSSPPDTRLSDPFDPIPTCSPGMLQSNDGKPLEETADGYPLRISWDGIQVDDPENSGDILRGVRDVLEIVWQQGSDRIEKEVCEVLGCDDLREYFRRSRKGGFWDDHVSRYSKSRRKAPIYWLLQSSKKNYALWLYYHRLDKDLLFKALVNLRRAEDSFGNQPPRNSSQPKSRSGRFGQRKPSDSPRSWNGKKTSSPNCGTSRTNCVGRRTCIWNPTSTMASF